MIQLMLHEFHLFSNFTGLQVNSAKFSLFCCGMSEDTIQDIVDMSGIQVGCLPFKYLGVLVSPWKLKAIDREALVD